MNKPMRLALTGWLLAVGCCGTALAQRGGGRAGGARHGGGAPGGGARPSFNRTPSFNAPAARPQMPAARPMPTPGQGAGARPGAGQPAARPMPAPGQGAGPQARPAPLPGQAGGNRPAIGNRPGQGQGPGGIPGQGGRPGAGNNTGNRPNVGNNVANRPNVGNNVANRPNVGNNVVNRPNVGNNVVNRPNVGNNVVNRPNVGNNVVNRPNIGNNVNINRPGGNFNSGNTVNNINVNNVNNRFTNVNSNRPNWTNGNPAWAYRPGWNYHQGWVNGYWHGQNNSNWWNNWGGFATGLAVGGIGAWGIGSSIYGWGYRPYVNPYAMTQPVVIQQPLVVEQPAPTVIVQQPADAQPTQTVLQPPVDYAQPLSTSAAPPEPAAADPAVQTFDEGRAAFKEGNYALALQKTDQALKSLPSDAAMHEFRALCLFALKQYEQSASTLYAVLSAGPGWDWTTMSGLYPSVDVYTGQLRALEDYRGAHPDSAPARFVLAYHYLTQGHTENAVDELKEVVKLQPSDQLSAQLVAQLSGAAAKPGEEAAPAPAPAAEAPPVPAEKLVGSWKASPAPDTTIALSLTGDAKFRWEIQSQGKTQPIEGSYTYEDGVLTLSQSETNAMVGKIAMVDDNHFKFQAMGGGAGDPGLTFGR